MFTLFNEKRQELILWQMKPSVIRILTSVMELRNVPFKHGETEDDLEKILEGKVETQLVHIELDT